MKQASLFIKGQGQYRACPCPLSRSGTGTVPCMSVSLVPVRDRDSTVHVRVPRDKGQGQTPPLRGVTCPCPRVGPHGHTELRRHLCPPVSALARGPPVRLAWMDGGIRTKT